MVCCDWQTCSPQIPRRIEIWKCWFLIRGENWSTQRKTSRSKDENSTYIFSFIYFSEREFETAFDYTEPVRGILFFFQGLVFKTFETLAAFDPDLLAGLIPAGKQAVIQLEQKRGVGTDMQLRWVTSGDSWRTLITKMFLDKICPNSSIAVETWWSLAMWHNRETND